MRYYENFFAYLTYSKKEEYSANKKL